MGTANARTTGQNSRQLQGFQPTPRRTKDRRQEKWEAYSNLPNEEKQRVREGGKSAKLLTAQPVLPETTTSQTPTRLQNTPQQLPPAQVPSN